MEDHHSCGCCHDHCSETKKTTEGTKIPLTMENLEKGIKNINILIDMIDTRQDDKKEAMVVFLKSFFDDLVNRYKNLNNTSENSKNEEKENDLERINKSLFQILQLKPAVMKKYGDEFLDKIWELSDDVKDYNLSEELLSQSFDKKMTPLKLIKFFLEILFGSSSKVNDLITENIILIDYKERKITINEEKIKEMTSANNEKFLKDNNTLCNLMLIKIYSYAKIESYYTGLSALLMTINNRVIKLYKLLSLYSFCIWNFNNKEKFIKGLIFIIGGVLKDFSRSLLKTKSIDINKLKIFNQKEEHFFQAITLHEKSQNLLQKFLLVIIVNFISIFVASYDENRPIDIQDGNYWDDYQGLILRLKDPKLTEVENDEIPKRVPLSLDMKCYIILFLTDFIFFFYTHFVYVKENKLSSDFDNFNLFNDFCKYIIISSNYNILTFFQRNMGHVRYFTNISERMEYELKDNFNTYGLFVIFYLLIVEKQIPLIINKIAYIATITEYVRIVFEATHEYGVPDKKEELMLFYVKELNKNKIFDKTNEDVKKLLYDKVKLAKNKLDEIYKN